MDPIDFNFNSSLLDGNEEEKIEEEVKSPKIKLENLPCFEVTDKSGETKFVYLVPSDDPVEEFEREQQLFADYVNMKKWIEKCKDKKDLSQDEHLQCEHYESTKEECEKEISESKLIDRYENDHLEGETMLDWLVRTNKSAPATASLFHDTVNEIRNKIK